MSVGHGGMLDVFAFLASCQRPSGWFVVGRLSTHLAGPDRGPIANPPPVISSYPSENGTTSWRTIYSIQPPHASPPPSLLVSTLPPRTTTASNEQSTFSSRVVTGCRDTVLYFSHDNFTRLHITFGKASLSSRQRPDPRDTNRSMEP